MIRPPTCPGNRNRYNLFGEESGRIGKHRIKVRIYRQAVRL